MNWKISSFLAYTRAYFPAKCESLLVLVFFFCRLVRSNAVHTQLDQAQQALVVRGCSGRDVRPAELDDMLAFMYEQRLGKHPGKLI